MEASENRCLQGATSIDFPGRVEDPWGSRIGRWNGDEPAIPGRTRAVRVPGADPVRALHELAGMTPRHGPSKSLALALLGLVACSDGGTPTELHTPTVLGEVVGLVTADGVPVEGVGVELTGGMVEAAVTGASGEYRFGGVPEGPYVVTLKNVPGDLEFTSDRTAALVTAGSAVVRADFSGRRRRDATLAVSVTVEGEGLEGVTVALAGPEAREATTDPQGTAAFVDLLAGSYEVEIAGYDADLVLFDAVERSAVAAHDAVVEVRFEGIPRIPLPPTGALAAADGPSRVDLSWGDASDNESSFEIERGETPGGPWIEVGSVAADATSYTDGDLSPATSYRYRLRACNAMGCSTPSNEVSVTTHDVPPAAPLALTAVPIGPGSIGLTWTDASGNETRFELERSGDGAEGWDVVSSLAAGSTEAVDTGLLPGTRYAYRVRACNDVGCSDHSGEAAAETADVPPEAPIGMHAVALSSDRIEVAWTDASANEASFEVVRFEGGAWSVAGLVEPDGETFIDTDLEPATAYGYRVRACNAAGCSDDSEEVSAVTHDVPPAAPHSVSANATGSGSVSVAWFDGSSNETRFEIERREGGPWTMAGSVAANTTHFADGGLAAETPYDYRVRACNPEGCSSWSGEATATTWPDGPNLTIQALHITQRTQRISGDVPLVADLDGLLRVFAVADAANGLQPDVIVEFFLGGVLAHTEILTAGSVGVPTAVDPSQLSRSWNVEVPSWLIQPGLAVRAAVDPNDAVGEANELDNVYPPSGAPLSVDVREASPFRVTFVPIRHAVNGTVGNVTGANADQFMRDVRKLFPVAADDVLLHAEYATSAPLLESDNGNGAWNTILGEIQALRVLEGGPGHYYGVVHPTYGGGIAGMGYVGWPAAIGWDKLSSAGSVAAHEWGHNLGRKHSPGCGAGGPDPNYPYPGGVIGAWGYDLATQALRSPSAYYDLMSYCGPEWISDYVYEKILEFREAAAAFAVPPLAASGILVWGRVEGGRTILEPSFHVTAPGTPPDPGGELTLEGRDSGNAVLFSFPFQPTAVADGAEGDGHFAIVVPLAALGGARLSELSVLRGGLRVAVRRARTPGLAVPSAPAAAVAAGAEGTAEVRWDPTAHPMVLVRDAATGEVLSFARGGEARVHPSSDRIQLVFSDGLASSPPQVRTWR